MKRGILAILAVALALPVVAEAQAVFIARKAVQRIHHMTEGGSNVVAAVMRVCAEFKKTCELTP